MNNNTKLAAVFLTTLFILCFSSLSCSPKSVTVTLPAKTTIIPTTQTVTTTSSTTTTAISMSIVTITNHTTIINPTTNTTTPTAPPVTTTTTLIAPPVTTTKPPLTVTQYWPPVTKMYMEAYYYYLPLVSKGQTVNFTVNSSGAPLSYYVRDPANNVIMNVKIDFGTLVSSNSFIASIDGTYALECVPAEGLPTVFSLSFYFS
jgi:hypothetical protein